MSDDRLKFSAMANAFALIASQRIDDLPEAYQPAAVERNLRRIAKTNRAKVKAARKQNRSRK